MSSFLVTGVGGPAGQNVAKLLLERKHRVLGTDMRELKMQNIEFHLVPSARDPGFLSFIYGIASREKVDVIIPTVSEELPVFADGWKWKEELPLLLAPAEAITIADDKYLTASALFEKDVSIPRFTLPSQVTSPEEVDRKIGWPCISKPRVGRGGREVAVYSEQDWPTINLLDDQFILQEFAGGVDYAPNVYLGRDGKATVVVIEKTELKEGIVGNALSVKRVESPDVAELAVAAARAIGLTGPADIDIRRRKDGVPVVLEINARFGANTRLAPEVLDAALEAS
ncbi:MAG: ATP-grasp domain-containing protein [Chloroflexota bacterium]